LLQCHCKRFRPIDVTIIILEVEDLQNKGTEILIDYTIPISIYLSWCRHCGMIVRLKSEFFGVYTVHVVDLSMT